jgi:hypothetical protein
MQGDTNEPVNSIPKANRTAARRTVLLLLIGGGVGMALGILLTLGVSAAYTLVTRTIPETRDSVQVFQELNQLRQQLNQLNEEKKLNEKLNDQAREEAVRQALSAVSSAARTPEGGMSKVAPPARKPGDPFAELDAEIERLEQTQKVLNTVLDLFSGTGKEGAKDR